MTYYVTVHLIVTLRHMQRLYKITSLLLCEVWFMYTCVVKGCEGVTSTAGCHVPGGNISGYLGQFGDLVIGGTFPIHLKGIYSETQFTSNPEDLKCQILEARSYQIMQAFIFTVEEINKNPDLFPNITLGFQIYDTCTVVRRAAEGTLWMLSGREPSVPNYNCGEGTLAGIVGDSGSTCSILMADILSLYRYPQISYFATSPLLSNRNLFPSFCRTVPSDMFQTRGLAELILYFGWTWVGLLASDNDYGQIGIQIVKQEIVEAGACVAFIENIMTGQPNSGAPHIINVIKNSSAKVVLVLSADADFMPVVEEFVRENITGKIWIASEAWSTSILLKKEKFQPVLMGSIGFAIHWGQMDGFEEHLNNLHPSKFPSDHFLLEFWEKTFSCKWTNIYTKADDMLNHTINECIGDEKLESAMASVDLSITFNVYTAVYAFAWAIHNLLQCKPGKGPFLNGTCANISSLHPWQLLHYIKTVDFETKDKTQIFFDDRGDPPALYHIVNWQPSPTGSMEQKIVGSYDSRLSKENRMKINIADIIWNTEVGHYILHWFNSTCK
ncbi:unnamed protein product [Ranitomeya imitator]|uniref:Receptor ligand binding region domain-containing protein n=1 Tax=Ranitomeya imitator TaxID=111125 RepID=A0ABN9MG08_9NEOB|nr:unnamed protein product [Ranitomeya imitator]